MMCLVKVHLNKAIDLHMTTRQRTAIHLIQIHAAHRAVGIVDRIQAAVILGTNMTDILIQTIPQDAVAVVIYFTDENEYESCKHLLQDLKSKINKPILYCLNKSLKVLNKEDLEEFGLQEIQLGTQQK